jgi:hypothetical protein
MGARLIGEKIYLFGLGTGRCGTVSLAKLLNAQKDSMVTHEGKPWLPWVAEKRIIRQKFRILDERDANIVGDVALFNLQSVKILLEELIPGAKFVVLRRNKKDTLDSFKRKWGPKYNRIAYKRTEWDYVFPNWQMTMPSAVNRYYDEYYREAFHLEEEYPQNVKCFFMQMLNSKEGVRSILDFCEIPEKDRVYKIGIRANEGNRA